uniref:Innexin n=1 Tax=Octopus bimaculoides TaxID=37653 RepID=A0A0L8GVA2_OCTBM
MILITCHLNHFHFLYFRIFESIAEFASFSKLAGNYDDDLIDRINHIYTVCILVIFSIVVTGGTYIGNAITCYIPKEGKDERDYIETFCWTGPLYHVPDSTSNLTEKRDVIHYYLWIPIILLFEALLFKTPNIIWQMTNKGSGMNLEKIAQLSEKTQLGSEKDRDETIEHIGDYINRWIVSNKRRSRNLLSLIKPKRGSYLTILYFIMKLLYCLNAISQFYLLNSLLRIEFSSFGLHVAEYVQNNEVMFNNSIFPRIAYCDYKFRQMSQVVTLKTQCVLPINVLNEKVFMFLWFFFAVISGLCLLNLLGWVYRMLSKRSYVNYIFKYLTINDIGMDKPSKRACLAFADDYLKLDGVLLMRVVGKNSTDLVVSDLVKYLWTIYVKENPPKKKVESTFP